MRLALVFLFSLSLVACGGGSGDSNNVAGFYRGVLGLIENTCRNTVGNQEVGILVNQDGDRIAVEANGLSLEGFTTSESSFVVYGEYDVECENPANGAKGIASSEVEISISDVSSDAARVSWLENYGVCSATGSLPFTCGRLWSGIANRGN